MTNHPPESPEGRAEKFYQQGLMYESWNNIPEAIRHYRNALKEAPFYPPALIKVGDYYLQIGESDLAMQYYSQFLQKTEKGKIQAPVLTRIGQLFLSQQHNDDGIRALRAAIQMDPQYRQSYFHLGHHFFNSQDYANARYFFEAYHQQAKDDSEDHWRIIVLQYLYRLYLLIGEPEAADNLLDTYQETYPALRLNRLTPPDVFANSEASETWLKTFDQNLNETDWAPSGLQHPLWEIRQPGHFNLRFLPGEHKSRMEQVSAIYRPFLEQNPPTFPSKEFELLRIGIFTTFSAHTLAMHLDMFRQLEKEFQTRFYTHASPPDFLNDSEWPIMILPQDIDKQVQILQNEKLDMLIYTDLDANHLQAYLLAHYQVAPKQIVMPGLPMTSGISSLTHLVTAQCFMAEEEAFSETVVALSGTPFDKPPALDLGPSPMRLPEDLSHWYLCPATAEEIHPDMDALLLGIIAKDPAAKICFLGDPALTRQRQLKQRLTQGNAALENQFFFLPPFRQQNHLRSVLQHFPVVLDTLYNGLDTLVLDSLNLGVPVVSWPQPTMRSRFARGLIQALDLESLSDAMLASDADSYIAKAVQLSTDSEFQEKISADISEQWDSAFAFMDYYRELRQFIRQQCPRNF